MFNFKLRTVSLVWAHKGSGFRALRRFEDSRFGSLDQDFGYGVVDAGVRCRMGNNKLFARFLAT